MFRKCTQCGEEKDLTRFVRQIGKYRKDPYRKDCKDCKNKKRRTGKPRKDFLKGRIPWNKGKKTDPEIVKKVSLSLKGRNVWNKGILKSKKRFARLYIKWRNSIYERDEYKCTICGSKENIQAHHIVPWKESEELRFDINNGKCVCHSCHCKIEPRFKHVKEKIWPSPMRIL